MINWILILYIAIALYTDLTRRKVYNIQVALGLVLGLILACANLTDVTPVHWIFGVVTAFLCLMPFYLVKGMAAGDVKLMMAIGGLVGYPHILDVIIFTFLFGGLFALVWVVRMGQLKRMLINLKWIVLGLFITSTTRVSVDLSDIKQQSVGRMPYVTAIAASVVYLLIFK